MRTLRSCLPAAAVLAACLPGPGPTDPDRPMPPIHTPARPAGGRATLADPNRVPSCWLCPDRARTGCYREGETNVCFAECRGSGLLTWDLGQPPPRACEAAAREHCESQGLGPLESACWGRYDPETT